ncbi:MAG: hypothetical protein KF841_01735 [Phycisphaerae bacterium]|nr:hypothetical protein [Phycisphaerae bacterium]
MWVGSTLCLMSRIVLQCRIPALILCCAVGVAGCEDKRRHQASENVEFPVVEPPVGSDAPADAVALAMLDAMRTLQRIRAVGFGHSDNKAKYDHAMGVIASLMDKDRVYMSVRAEPPPSVPRDIKRDAAVRLVAESWVSAIAHYLEGMESSTRELTIRKKGEILFEQNRAMSADGKIERSNERVLAMDEATLYVDAVDPHEREMLAEIESSDEMTKAVGSDGKPLAKGTEAYLAKLRLLTIPRGFNVPIGAVIVIRLSQTPDGWRVFHLHLQG